MSTFEIISPLKAAENLLEKKGKEILHIEEYIKWFNTNLEEANDSLYQIQEALRKGGFSEFIWNQYEGNRLEDLLLFEPFDKNRPFIIHIIIKAKIYKGSMKSSSYQDKVMTSLQKKKEKVQEYLPKGYTLKPLDVFSFSNLANSNETFRKIKIQIKKG